MKRAFLNLVILLSAVCGVFAQSPSYKSGYVNPVPGRFPIRAWTSFLKDTYPSEKEFRWLVDAGFNIGSEWIGDTALMSKVLDRAALFDVRMVIASSGIGNLNRLPSTVARFKNNKALWGYFVSDEPRPTAFEECLKYKKAIQKADPAAMPFVNLLPAMGSDLLKAKDYSAYVSEFVKIYSPELLCVDCYPVRERSGRAYVYDRFYETYETISSYSRNDGIPFWAICLCTAHTPFQFPDENNMRFAAFTALAYGAQGIGWWSYCQPEHNDEDFRMSAINEKNGKRTKIWYALRTVNKEIQDMSRVFLDAELVGVWHTGSNLPAGTTRLGRVPDPVTSVGSGDAGVLVSHLRKNGENYLVVVTHDVNRPQNVSIGTSRNITRIYPDGKDVQVSNPKFSLPACGYAVFRL